MLPNEVQRQQQTLKAQARELAALKAQQARMQAALVERNRPLAARLERLDAAAGNRGLVNAPVLSSV